MDPTMKLPQPLDTATAARDFVRGANATAQRAATRVRTIVLPIHKAKGDSSVMAGSTSTRPTAAPIDPLSALASRGEVIEPPFDLFTLSMLPEMSSELGQCVEAMEVNIDGFGHRILPRKVVGPNTVDTAVANEIALERVRLLNFFQYAALEDSMVALRRKTRRDLETTGNGYWEIIRGVRGDIQGFQHVPSYLMRLGKADEWPVEVPMKVLETQLDGSTKVVTRLVQKRFRKFVQSRTMYLRSLESIGGFHTVWFKEFGDPRIYDNQTGLIVEPDRVDKLPAHRRANEILHFKLYSTRSPYGLPRFIGNLLSIFGDRTSEEVNYTTFKNNNIPSMLVLVSNGQITQESIDRIKEFTADQIQGSDNYSKFLILEGEGTIEGEDGGQVKIDVKPLVEQQHKDALFQNYSEKNHDKIRRSFRLPGIYVGRTDDVARATADISRRLADEQIFAPEREEFDDVISRRLFPDMDVVHHRFKSNSPSTTDNTQLVKILSEAEKTGGMTPRIARGILEEVLNRDLPDLPEDPRFPVDLPFSMTMAEAVKNMAQPNLPSQQVTAVKRAMEDAGVDVSDVDGVEDLVELVKASYRMERRWREAVSRSQQSED